MDDGESMSRVSCRKMRRRVVVEEDQKVFDVPCFHPNGRARCSRTLDPTGRSCLPTFSSNRTVKQRVRRQCFFHCSIWIRTLLAGLMWALQGVMWIGGRVGVRIVSSRWGRPASSLRDSGPVNGEIGRGDSDTDPDTEPSSPSSHRSTHVWGEYTDALETIGEKGETECFLQPAEWPYRVESDEVSPRKRKNRNQKASEARAPVGRVCAPPRGERGDVTPPSAVTGHPGSEVEERTGEEEGAEALASRHVCRDATTRHPSDAANIRLWAVDTPETSVGLERRSESNVLAETPLSSGSNEVTLLNETEGKEGAVAGDIGTVNGPGRECLSLDENLRPVYCHNVESTREGEAGGGQKVIVARGEKCSLCDNAFEEGDVVMTPTGPNAELDTCTARLKHHRDCFERERDGLVFLDDKKRAKYGCDCGRFHLEGSLLVGRLVFAEEEGGDHGHNLAPGDAPPAHAGVPGVGIVTAYLGDRETKQPTVPARRTGGEDKGGVWALDPVLFSPSPAVEVYRAFAEVDPDGLAVVNGRIMQLPSVDLDRIAPSRLMKRFRQQDRLSRSEVRLLLDEATRVLNKEQNMLQLEGDTVLVGDLHGQFFDLVGILDKCGEPTRGQQYLFMGDYVDRGNHSCEVFLLLASLKVVHPDRVFLLRGNHETANQTAACGFMDECISKYGRAVYQEFLDCFQALPLCAILRQNEDQDGIFCVHGGLSPRLLDLRDIDLIERRAEPKEGDVLMDLLWADPREASALSSSPILAMPCADRDGDGDGNRGGALEVQERWAGSKHRSPPLGPSGHHPTIEAGEKNPMPGANSNAMPAPVSFTLPTTLMPTIDDDDRDHEAWVNRRPNREWDDAGSDGEGKECEGWGAAAAANDFRPNLARGCSFMYGRRAAQSFLEANSLRGVVRAHSVQGEGFQQHFGGIKDNHHSPLVSPSFSDPVDKCDRTSSSSSTHCELPRGGAEGATVAVEEEILLSEVTTVFSAPGYEGGVNKGAVLRARACGAVTAVTYDAEQEPPLVDGLMEAIRGVCPFMPTCLEEWADVRVKPAIPCPQERGSDSKRGIWHNLVGRFGVKVEAPGPSVAVLTAEEVVALRALWEAMCGGEQEITEATLFAFDDSTRGGEASHWHEVGVALQALTGTGVGYADDKPQVATSKQFLLLALAFKSGDACAPNLQVPSE